jgi:hypothetical protein
MVVLIVDQPVIPMFSDHPEERVEMLTFKDHKKDQAVTQISVVHQKVQIQGNRITVLQGIQVIVTQQGLQVFVDLPKIDLTFNDHPADPAVQIQEVRGDQEIVKEEEIDQYTEQFMINC